MKENDTIKKKFLTHKKISKNIGENMDQIIEMLKEERVRRKLKQKEVAKYLGMSQSTYSKIEQGNQKILAEDLAKLAILYEVSFDKMLKIDL